MTGRVFESVCPTTVGRRLAIIQSSPPPVIKGVEPTVYSVSSSSQPKSQRVRLGNPHRCTCKKNQPCLHVLAVLLFALRIPASSTLIWQQGLTELELSAALDDVKHGCSSCCRFCQEQLTEPEGCAGCDCLFHRTCLELKCRAQNKTVCCPECHSVQFRKPAVRLCSACKTQLTPRYYECALCPHYALCSRCYDSKVHVEHPFRLQDGTAASSQLPNTDTPESLMLREINPEDYDTLLSLDANNKQCVLSETQYATLPHPLWGRRDNKELCPICLSPFRFKDRCVCLPCGHVLHDACGKTWLTTHKGSCPVDNTKVALGV